MKNLLLVIPIALLVGCPQPVRESSELRKRTQELMASLNEPYTIHGEEIGELLVGECVSVEDGVSITVVLNEEQIYEDDGPPREIKVRLSAIDSPELNGQPFGLQAKQALAKMVFGLQVTVNSVGTDKYGRTLAYVTRGDGCANTKMVKQGFAWRNDQSSDDDELVQLEQQARKAKRGLWAGQSDLDQIPPWLWRERVRSRAKITLSNGEVMTTKQFHDRDEDQE